MIGVLGLQGCIEPHLQIFAELGVKAGPVRDLKELESSERLLLPGGESSTMLKLLHRRQIFHPLSDFVRERPCWGVCAGSILLAKEVTHPRQDSLNAIGIRAHRNYYGSQRESFETQLEVACSRQPVHAQFIRAPHFEIIDSSIEVLACFNEQPVLVQKDNVLASAFHVELGENRDLHRHFLEM